MFNIAHPGRSDSATIFQRRLVLVQNGEAPEGALLTRNKSTGAHMGNSFNPDEMNLLAKVVDEACRKVGCADERAKEILAMRVLRLAARGERDFGALLSAALNGEAIAHAA
jgi:hypothetical protein